METFKSENKGMYDVIDVSRKVTTGTGDNFDPEAQVIDQELEFNLKRPPY